MVNDERRNLDMRTEDREYIRQLVEHERELRVIYVNHERELRQQYERIMAENLRLQAAEYERRMIHLNDAFARADEVKHTFLPREIFEGFLKQDREWKAEQIAGHQRQPGRQSGRPLSQEWQ